jgi:UDP-3-O-[3-hydroxymyristoyl] N-acetylglucosamine deacetylase / 3-hydroxyacyl-[acyl-carrier-protein] dehydratase
MSTRRDHPQRTLAQAVTVEGVGLFTAQPVKVRVGPADADEGVTFIRSDLPGAPTIRATLDSVIEAPRHTVLEAGDARVETVEHCLAALAGLGIDNARVEVNGPELPIGDGSAAVFAEPIAGVGAVEQDAARDPLVIEAPITVRDGEATLTALPADLDAPEFMYFLDYGEDSPIGRQHHALHLDPAAFMAEIAPARTFSTADEARQMRALGLFQHVEPRDMLVIGQSGPIDNELLFHNEPVRHKLLDLIGDLALVGRPVLGRIVAYRSGHALNHKLGRALLEASRNGSTERPASPAMDIRAIRRLLPHRYPMILVDRVIYIDEDRKAIGLKNVTINEPFFQGHYPDQPIMPGVLIVEALCQLGGLMLSHKLERTGKVAVLLAMDDVRLRKTVTPGDQLVMETETIRAGSRYGDVQCRAYVAGALVAEARVKFMMVDAEKPL